MGSKHVREKKVHTFAKGKRRDHGNGESRKTQREIAEHFGFKINM
jgi:hypothetical protein